MPWLLNTALVGGDPHVDFRLEDDAIMRHSFLGMPPNPSLPDEHVVPPPDDWPIPIRQTSSHAEIPDYVCGPYTNQILVSAGFRDLLEDMEPDVHHFVPVHLRRPDGSVDETSHFLFYNGQWTEDSIILGQSSVTRRLTRRTKRPFLELDPSAPRITWNRSKISGCHLWADTQLWSVICVSDGLYQELSARKPRGFVAFESRAIFLT